MSICLRRRRGCRPKLRRGERACVVDRNGCHGPEVEAAVTRAAVRRAVAIDGARGRCEGEATVYSVNLGIMAAIWAKGAHRARGDRGFPGVRRQRLGDYGGGVQAGGGRSTYDAQQAIYPLDQVLSCWVVQPDGHTRGLSKGAMELEAPTMDV